MKREFKWFNKVSKVCFFGFLFLLLFPSFLMAFKNEVNSFSQEFSTNSNQTIEKSRSENSDNFETLLSLINFLLAGLTVVPILSAFLLWGLKHQIKGELTMEAEKLLKKVVF